MHSILSFSKTARRGFNLVEAAIVLGIVGLVIGGIWVAAAQVSFNHKINSTMLGIVSIATQIQNEIKISDGDRMGCCPNITPLMIKTGGVPAGWSVNSTNDGFITPLGQAASASSFQNRFDFVFDKLNQAECIALVSKLTAALKTTSINITQGITIYTNSYGGTVTFNSNPSTWPAIPTAAQCIAGNNVMNLITNYTNN